MIHGCKGDFGMICDVCGDSLDAPDGRVLGFKTKREMNSALWRMRNKPKDKPLNKEHGGEIFCSKCGFSINADIRIDKTKKREQQKTIESVLYELIDFLKSEREGSEHLNSLLGKAENALIKREETR